MLQSNDYLSKELCYLPANVLSPGNSLPTSNRTGSKKAQILSLAAKGLSDKDVGAKVGTGEGYIEQK